MSWEADLKCFTAKSLDRELRVAVAAAGLAAARGEVASAVAKCGPRASRAASTPFAPRRMSAFVRRPLATIETCIDLFTFTTLAFAFIVRTCFVICRKTNACACVAAADETDGGGGQPETRPQMA
eukprot:CAMPEP_0115189662 /NCGR_PEP_ID=MMETSP0270-20121206/11628_1 /TAXON_ID=71861 /ORGANISM="Scrippsiella trochoidea, Strain CCMP3099" /LENGTH=124 /DNA_ID=CAMNT_0002602855 /DNA_START=343 /DNA_END=718 /DNA_ORIENTATION=+